MALGIATKCLKYLLLLFNVVFSLAGIAVFAVALWLRFSNRSKSIFDLEGNTSSFYTGVHVMIVAGALMLALGFLGCCGAIQMSKRLLCLHFSCLLVIFAMLIAIGIWGYSKQNQLVMELQTFYKDTLAKYLETGEDSLKETLKTLHSALTCCGLTSSLEAALSGTCPDQDGTVTVKLCPVAIDEFIHSKLRIFGIIGFGFGIVLIIGMILSMVLCCAILKNKDTV